MQDRSDLEKIKEKLAQALKDGKELFSQQDADENPEFRRWRHDLETLLETAERLKYNISCDIHNRAFSADGYYAVEVTVEQNIQYYNIDLQDTLNELETAIQFLKDFPPKAELVAPKQPKVKSLKKPEKKKPTLKERVENSIVIWAVITIIASVAIGIGIGAYISFKNDCGPAVEQRKTISNAANDKLLVKVKAK